MLLAVGIGDDSCLVFKFLPSFSPFGEHHLLHAVYHHAFRGHIHHILKCFVQEILLHLGDIRHAGFRHFLKLGIVDISPVKCYDITAVVVGGRSIKESPLAAEVKRISEGTNSLA